ncbi:MAG: PQQ-binding-like beta-propeller repeat protein [Spirochaetes bacterium]|nr:PQQ-binding-like beta-propeller repeat protein [Spirochaetota bacterium]
MNGNPYLKKLKAFDPKTDLTVNETFTFDGSGIEDSALFESTENDNAIQKSHPNFGKEFTSFRANSAISATLAKISNFDGSIVLIACDNAGNVFILNENQGSLELREKFKISGSIIKRPAYADGVLYIVTREGMICAVVTGLNRQHDTQQKAQLLWQKKLEKGIHTEPIATGKLLIVAALDGLYCFEAYYKNPKEKAIGKQLWHQQIAGGTVSTPLLDGGTIYLGTEEKKLVAIEYGGDKARISWSVEASAQIRVRPSLALQNSFIIFPSIDGSVYCLDKSQRKLRWVFIVKSPVLSPIFSLPIDGREYLFFGADDGFFYCISEEGKEVWKYKTNGKIRTEAAYWNGVIYFGSEDNNLYAVDAKKGNLIFKFTTDGNINGSPVIVDDRIYFGSSDSFIHGIHI